MPLTESRRPAESIDSLLLSRVLEITHEHLMIADGQGRMLRASPSCGAVYGMSPEALCARSAAELERDGVLSPSVTLKVLDTQQTAHAVQVTPTGRRVLATGYPVFIDGRLERVISCSRDAQDLRRLEDEYEQLSSQLASQLRRRGGQAGQRDDDVALEIHSPAMREAVNVLRRVAPSDATIMLLGETGVGKTALAHQVHQWSTRRHGPFVDVNCSAIPESLFESEMFGSMPGAFSGAPPGGRPGLLEQAQGGTLLLDEVGELPLTIQAKLLKVLQEGAVTRLGDTRERQLDFRLIVATNRDLPRLVDAGQFRLDLFYRLYVVPVRLPPLRERAEDIPALVERYMARLNERYGATRVIDDALWPQLIGGYWRGNVRELENFLERHWLATGDRGLRNATDPIVSGANQSVAPASAGEAPIMPLREEIAATERRALRRAMEGASSTYEIAARLRISQPSVVRKLRKHRLTLARPRPSADHGEAAGS